MSRRRKFLLIVSILLWFAIDVSLALAVPVYGAMFAQQDRMPPIVAQVCVDIASFRRTSTFYAPLFHGGLVGAVMLAAKKERKYVAMGFVACSFLAFAVFTLAFILHTFAPLPG